MFGTFGPPPFTIIDVSNRRIAAAEKKKASLFEGGGTAKS
jgi:hypothetical protein